MNVIPFRRKPPSLPKLRWDIYKAAGKAKLLGTIEAPTADSAIRRAVEEFKLPDGKKLIVVQRRWRGPNAKP